MKCMMKKVVFVSGYWIATLGLLLGCGNNTKQKNYRTKTVQVAENADLPPQFPQGVKFDSYLEKGAIK